MQSFLVSTDSFEATAAVLDNKRLHKQTLEAWQCLLNMCGLDPDGNDRAPKGWSSHPVVKMWRGHETLLVSYITATYFEWRSRGYKSTLLEKTLRTYDTAISLGRVSSDITLPTWMQDANYFERLCSTHRVALLNKNYEWYSQFKWAEDTGERPPGYEYLWPHQDGYVLAS